MFVLILRSGEGAFQREGFARQSMSEKRKKANLDPRLLEFYQKVKEVKESKGDTTAFYSGKHPTPFAQPSSPEVRQGVGQSGDNDVTAENYNAVLPFFIIRFLTGFCKKQLR